MDGREVTDIEVVDVSVLSWRRLGGGFMYPVRKVLNILTLCVYKDESFQDGCYTNEMQEDLYMSSRIVEIIIPLPLSDALSICLTNSNNEKVPTDGVEWLSHIVHKSQDFM